ncbi:putative glycoside hydrolase family 15 protein [Lentzea sp. NPDC006480]|uniref:putative glycoside hydrolase family 15 protein n=1 Tax=Lentzea sp. NPDC006480 TaxID=3157176 RepID=UPI0033A5D94D
MLPKESLTGRLLAVLLVFTASACTYLPVSDRAAQDSLAPPDPSIVSGPHPKPLAPCAWWYGIGAKPTSLQLKFAAEHYSLVVLNAWETGALRRLRQLNPKVKVLVYKDFSSTRNYPGTVDNGVDATYLPTGLGFAATEKAHPDWFALDTADKRIEWAGYEKHWQMTVWTEAYQRAWTKSVVDEVVREGWDGVLADNDFSSLRFYSPAVLKGTADVEATDRLLRDGYDSFLGIAGDELQKAGKMLVPNVSESHLRPGRWTAHSRYDGAMEENFGLRDDGGGAELLTFRGNEFKELRAQAALGESWLLLVTHTASPREERVGYATAALLAGPYTCWNGASPDYKNPSWSQYQEAGLGEAVEAANRMPNGLWTRAYSNGWVVVNPTSTAVQVTPPAGLVDINGVAPTLPFELAGADAKVLVKPKAGPTSPPIKPPTVPITPPTTTTKPLPPIPPKPASSAPGTAPGGAEHTLPS